jgi:hypothetical protein
MCHAHSVGARVVVGADFPNDQIGNVTAQDAWIAQMLATVQSNYIDGAARDAGLNSMRCL